MSDASFRPRATFSSLKALPLLAYARNSLYQSLVVGPDRVCVRVIRRHCFGFGEIETVGYRSFLGHHVTIVPRRGISLHTASFRRAADAIAVLAEMHRRGLALDRPALAFAGLPGTA
jgi:hypothetical protein